MIKEVFFNYNEVMIWEIDMRIYSNMIILGINNLMMIMEIIISNLIETE